MRFGFILVLAAWLSLSSNSSVAQTLDAESIRVLSEKKYPDAHIVAYQAKSKFTFYKSSDRTSPLTAKQETELILNYQSTSKRLVYFEYTNSYSKIRETSAEKYDTQKNAFKRGNAVIETFAYESNGIFHNDFFVNALKIYDNEKGIYKLKYGKLVSNYKFLTSISLWENAPVLNQEVTVEIPSWLELDILEQNFEGYDIEKKESKSADGSRILSYTWNDIPEIKSYSYSPSSNHYLPHLLLIYKSFDRSGKKEPLMPATADLYDWYKSLVIQVEEQPDELKDLAASFASIPKGREQIFAVNNWVRDNIRYIAFESGIAGFMPDACQKVYSNKYGDCKGMANLAKHILLLLGYDARLAWIGTRGSVPYDYSIASLAVDNHMIAAVKYENEFLFLDPTETYGTPEAYAYRIQGRPVMIEDGDNFILQTVPASSENADRISRSVSVTLDPASLTNRFVVEENFTGEPKKSILSGYNSIASQDKQERLEDYLRPNRTGSFEMIEANGLDGLSEEINLKYAFSTGEGLINLGTELYIDIDPNGDMELVEFGKPRLSPWYFSENYNRQTVINFEVPGGYELSHNPESFMIDHENFRIAVQVDATPSSVKVTKSLFVKGGSIDNEHSASWEEGLSRLKEYYEDRIIITKN